MIKKILITGTSGQIGWELVRSLQGLGEIVAPSRKILDLRDAARIREVVREVAPDLIVNAAAYTAVDQAEQEPELAMAINGDAPGVLAEEAVRQGAVLVHYSTDYVFDGAQREPYTEAAQPNPLNVYGRSKLAGEQAIAASGAAHVILRTSWVYGLRGSNFLLSIMRAARSRAELRIVSDQYGAPTWCRTVAELSAHIVTQGTAAGEGLDWWHARSGIYHLSAQGRSTWHDFAQLIVNRMDLAARPQVLPISAREHAAVAERPVNSLLDNGKLAEVFGLRAPSWQAGLGLCLGVEPAQPLA
ncbi:MAG: dTDP-4-dehydrorhamnose reductase [Burkholderiales bacterium]|nr:dTDP-4-dehydrorhamnose reductase [Burkholderiales bacterium]